MLAKLEADQIPAGMLSGQQVFDDFARNHVLTQDQIEQRADSLESTFTNRSAERQIELVNLVCPHCGAEFATKKSEILRDRPLFEGA